MQMKVLTLLLVLLLLLINLSVQQCTIEQFQNIASIMVMSSEATGDKRSVIINRTYYNCLSRSDTSDHYSSMSVSILYIRSRDPNSVREVRYNLQCNSNMWEIVGNQSTALRSNTSYDCSSCTDQTVNDYHCTSKLIEHHVYLLFHVCLFIDINRSNINITSSFRSVTLLEGGTVTLSCTPSVMGTVLWWTHNGTSVIQRSRGRMFTLPTQNFIIINAGINASGIYTCRDAMDNPVLQKNITVTVLPGNELNMNTELYWTVCTKLHLVHVLWLLLCIFVKYYSHVKSCIHIYVVVNSKNLYIITI